MRLWLCLAAVGLLLSAAPLCRADEDDGDDTDKPEPTTTAVEQTTSEAQTTTEEPVLNFVPQCVKDMCTYTMQVPGLDIDTYQQIAGMIDRDNNTVEAIANTEVPDLQKEVYVMLSTVDDRILQLQAEYDDLDKELLNITSTLDAVQAMVIDISDDIKIANNTINTFSDTDHRSGCYFRTCIKPEPKITTTPTTPTTTTTRFNFCKAEPYPCAHGGQCDLWYDSFKCTCTGNLDGAANCTTSSCAKSTAVAGLGLVVSPGYVDAATHPNTPCAGGGSWVISTKSDKMLNLVESDEQFKTSIASLPADAVLSIAVDRYSLKINTKTKASQVNSILNKGSQVTVTYSTPSGKGFFQFSLTEKA